MKPQARMLIFMACLMLPYIFFVQYYASKLPQQPLPQWFPYVAAGYFFGSIALATVLRKRIIGPSPQQAPKEQMSRTLSAARGARALGYIWLLGPVFYLLSGSAFKEPIWITLFGFLWVGLLSWASLHAARNLEKKAQQQSVAKI